MAKATIFTILIAVIGNNRNCFIFIISFTTYLLRTWNSKQAWFECRIVVCIRFM